jgi:osmotically-inducible protein OsmY
MAVGPGKKKGDNPHVRVGGCLRLLGNIPRARASNSCMPRLKSVAVSIIVLAAALQGCAVYEKCGLRGCPGDADTTARVNALFDQHPVLEPPNLLHVQTLDHVVYLTGLVDTDLERQIAESVALEAGGVTKVVNSIGLTGSH